MLNQQQTPSALALIAVGNRLVDCAILALDRGDIVANASVPASGFQAGAVIDPRAAHGSIVRAIVDAERGAGVQASAALVAFAAGFVRLDRAQADLVLDPPIVTADAAHRLEHALRSHCETSGRIAIHVERGAFDLDGRIHHSPPLERFGRTLALEIGAATVDGQSLRRLIEAVEATDLPVIGVVPAGLAAGLGASNSAQRRAGIAVAHIGHDLTTLAAFRDDRLTALTSIALGLDHLVADLAAALDVDVQKAERIILEHGMSAVARAGRVDAPLHRADGDSSPTSLPARPGSTDARADLGSHRCDLLLGLLADRFDAGAAALPSTAPIVLTGPGARIPGICRGAAHVWARDVRHGMAQEGLSAIIGGLALAAVTPAVGLRFGRSGQQRHVA